jgi:hypothetical protein
MVRTPPRADEVKLVSVLYSNRALCHKMVGDWGLVEADSGRAVEVDRANVKGHYLLGQAMCKRAAWLAGIRSLEKALAMAQRGGGAASLISEIQVMSSGPVFSAV